MKSIAILFLAPLALIAQTYTITNQSGHTLEIKDPYYDGEELKFKRVSDGRTFRIDPATLKPDSWKNLNQAATARMGISLTVKPRSLKKDEETHWSTSWGSHESSYKIARSFGVEVRLTNHFTKPITVRIYFVDGRDRITVQTYPHQLSYSNPFRLDGSVKGTQEVLHLNALGITFSSGDSVRGTDYAVTVHHADGSIADSYATNKSALDAILAYHKKVP
jgi:hypothetical protein